MKKEATSIDNFGVGGSDSPNIDTEQIEGHNPLTDLEDFLCAVTKKYGPQGRELMIGRLQGDISAEQTLQESEKLPDFETFQDRAMELLEAFGAVERIQNNIIVDIEKIKQFRKFHFKYDTTGHGGYRYSGKSKYSEVGEEEFAQMRTCAKDLSENFAMYTGDNVQDFLSNVFQDQLVMSREDWERHQKGTEIEPKPLLYSPKSKKEAFDAEAIKKNEFYVAPWELPADTRQKPMDSPFSPYLPDVPYWDACIAGALYHPNFGDGQRDKNGRLTVIQRSKKIRYTNHDPGQRTHVSAGYFVYPENAPGGNIYLDGTKLSSAPQQLLKEGHFPKLTENSLLLPSDFASMSTSSATKKFGFTKMITNKKGLVTINDGIRYNVGAKFGKGDYEVHAISSGTAALVQKNKDGTKTITHTLDLVQLGDKKLKPFLGAKAFDLNKRDLNLRPYEEAEHRIFTKKRNGELDADYQKRIEVFNYANLLELKQSLARETDVSMESLTTHERATFVEVYEKIKNDVSKKEELFEFVKTFKENGLKAFLAIQYDPDAADKILSIKNQYDIPQAALVFEKYAGLSSRANNIDQELEEFFDKDKKTKAEDQRDGATDEIMRRAGRLLSSFASGDSSRDIRSLLEDLDQTNDAAVTFSSIFRTAYKGRHNVDFKEVKGVNFEKTKIEDISDELKAKMYAVAEANWKPRGRAGEGVLEEFKQMLDRGTDSDFYILTQGEDLLSFTRFDDMPEKPGHKYWGSFNVNPKYRGSALGEAMLVNAVEKEAEDSVLEATVHPGIVVGTDYVEKRGFSITNVLENYDDSGESFFEIVLDKKQNNQSQLKDSDKFSQTDFVRLFDEEFTDSDPAQLLDKDIIVQAFSPESNAEEYSKMVDVTDYLLNQGYTGVRFFKGHLTPDYRYIVFEKNNDISEQQIREQIKTS